MNVTNPAYKRYALALLTSVYSVNLLDRALMSLLLQPIKEDLHLSDTQLGLVTGIAFGLFYATLGLPIARWADRGNRTTISSLAIGLWGLTVMSVPLVTNYIQLVLARMAAAVGESGCKPPTYSLLGDYFPRTVDRTRAMSIYWAGGSFAPVVGFSLGGWLNELYGWRATFFLMGIPGLLLAVLVKLTLAEPRFRSGSAPVQGHALPSVKIVVSTLWHRRSCRHLALALILLFTMIFGMAPWQVVFMMRSHAVPSAELGMWFGLIHGLSAGVGVLLGGYVANRWFVNNERGQMRLTSLMIASATLWYVAFLAVPQKHLAMMMLVLLMLTLGMFVAPIYTLMQRLVPDGMRATMMATIMLLYNLIGMSVGPLIVGVLSDFLTPALGSNSLRWAMLSMSFVVLWSAYHFWQVGRTVSADLIAVAAERRLVTLNFDENRDLAKRSVIS